MTLAPAAPPASRCLALASICSVRWFSTLCDHDCAERYDYYQPHRMDSSLDECTAFAAAIKLSKRHGTHSQYADRLSGASTPGMVRPHAISLRELLRPLRVLHGEIPAGTVKLSWAEPKARAMPKGACSLAIAQRRPMPQYTVTNPRLRAQPSGRSGSEQRDGVHKVYTSRARSRNRQCIIEWQLRCHGYLSLGAQRRYIWMYGTGSA